LKIQIIPYSRQSIDASDIRAVTRVLKSNFLTQGPEIEAFEREFAKFCGAKFSVACSSATAGLNLSAVVLGMGPGDLWWTSPNTFCATADAALRCGSRVDFIDIEWGTYNMDLALLEDRLKQASRKNRLPKVVAPVHFAGNPVDMEFLNRLRKRYGFKVVEDAAHATGAEHSGERIGSCRWSDLCVFSFHAVKIITTGEGGMITTNSRALYEKLCRLRTHGISRDPSYRPQGRRLPWYYEKIDLGNHYRMSDMQAALGRSQLKRIKTFHTKREAIAKLYTSRLIDLPLDLPRLTPRSRSSWHLFPICIRGDESLRNMVMKRLHSAGIKTNMHYCSIAKFQFYKKIAQYNYMSCPQADKYVKQEISLPVFPDMDELQKKHIIEEIKKALA
jgi:UDP-4-amino-4,6-dideoxy-N-acetyl-beta-L-altrosamine transaminase